MLEGLRELMLTGSTHTYPKGQVIYALDFAEEVYLVKSGYVARCSVTSTDVRSVQAIYGTDYFFPLTPVFKKLLNLNLGQDESTYIYEAMTDVEIQGISSQKLAAAVEASPSLYADLFYEAGRRLKSNIHRLENAALDSDYKKLAHHLVYLADEFGTVDTKALRTGISIVVPLNSNDLAQQLNVSVVAVEAGMKDLKDQDLLTVTDNHISVLDLDMLKDIYL